ncbi:MAG: CDP-alcohol phosphatidyltransferase family protein [Hydrogenobacter sp.]|uniref:CDP-alcohol phosphatidyltransferase family protein n=1 Tax=Hydrogenobacter thermophilus TaxID=940 RepID=UPI0030F7F66C
MLSFCNNLPNFISLLRLLLSPLMLYMDQRFLPYLFSFLALTDALDGFLARSLKKETQLGRVLDPLADKVFLITALFLCVFKLNLLNPILFFSLLARDSFILFGSLLLLLKLRSIPKPSLWGKITTLVISLSLFICMIYSSYPLNLFLYVLSQFFVLISWIDYTVKGLKALKSQTSF